MAGGPPVPLTNGQPATEFPGSWSLDGSWFAYISIQDGKLNLTKVKTTGQATPVVVKADVSYDNNAVPVWSPAGDWILLGERLYSPDGKTDRSLGDHHSEGYAFAPEGTRVYGMRPDDGGEALFTVDIASGAEKVIGRVSAENRPRSNLNPAMRLSLAPDGKSMVFGVGKFKDNLWMLEGFAAKSGLLKRLGL